MPLYVYQVIEADGSEGEVFETLQGMSEAPLTQHPENGKPVRRLLSAPRIAGKFTDIGAGSLAPKNLTNLGFTQYKKAGGGYYEKTAGSGPDVISRDDVN
ncbi:FmdB family transcriptional regulator [Telmatocola sphagniphila]|uniref:FmdB family transcriptional regulator n=1 Tax=Telmatocola sphagniphila TaxID=1123043 RepID=A0A8E6B3R2_9BACT|nr:FmdB family transcriptional regulator [Telmatocola sphagniphila]QVL29810.1 FmdB family transcriptional regulator [Telmatocola sphagniphila]